ncbi:MAG: Rieske (2Fe-2S) protein [Gammaproteobacteria bacterium]|nr:Rieske (2Fe-2S) protein [Gammaproteobacteria bacterium]
MKSLQPAKNPAAVWVQAASLTALKNKNPVVFRHCGKQVALFQTGNGIHACNNRCPHEGYPLAEGNLSNGCTLTCNWHNWKFDLMTGTNLYGGDQLRIYPVETRGDEIWIDVSDPPYEDHYKTVIENLKMAFEDHGYDRLAREIARLIRLGGDPLDGLRLAIQWSYQKMEFGWTHAYAGMADWLVLFDQYHDDEEVKLVCLLESVAHTAFDVLREKDYPFTERVRPFDATGFLRAIEEENEDSAVSMVRGGMRDGMKFDDFEPLLTRAALAHYNDFGHSLIYVTKLGTLANRLGDAVLEPLLLSLVREMVYATREEKIPEFRGYTHALDRWGTGNNMNPMAGNWRRKGVRSALEEAVDCSRADPAVIYEKLLLANAVNLLSFDISRQDKVQVPVSDNVGWLNFTHGLTFSNAVRKQCTRFPELWPQGLLQMACFSGRNAAFTTTGYELDRWTSGDPERDIRNLTGRIVDHGQSEYIVSVHLLKTTLAVAEEAANLATGDALLLTAALTRFLHSPLKRKQTLRTAYQSINFVRKD